MFLVGGLLLLRLETVIVWTSLPVIGGLWLQWLGPQPEAPPTPEPPTTRSPQGEADAAQAQQASCGCTVRSLTLRVLWPVAPRRRGRCVPTAGTACRCRARRRRADARAAADPGGGRAAARWRSATRRRTHPWRADSNFIFGSTGSGRAQLTINDVGVPVAPNGGFLAFIPVPSDGVYRLAADANGETASLDHGGARAPRGRQRRGGRADPVTVPGTAHGPAAPASTFEIGFRGPAGARAARAACPPATASSLSEQGAPAEPPPGDEFRRTRRRSRHAVVSATRRSYR
jgi:hypothetical protein